MACPICDHTMQYVGGVTGPYRYWCPRCGTIKDKVGDRETFEAPMWTRLARDGHYQILKAEVETAPTKVPPPV